MHGLSIDVVAIARLILRIRACHPCYLRTAALAGDPGIEH